MSDTRYSDYQHYGTAAQRAAFTPVPPATGQPIYLWYETDTGKYYFYTTTWIGPFYALGDATIALTDGATPALNAALGHVFRLSTTTTPTIAVPSNPTSGQKIIIEFYASGGARTLALNTGAGGFRFGADITSLTATTSGKTDYIGAIYNATDNYWDVVAVAKGY